MTLFDDKVFLFCELTNRENSIIKYHIENCIVCIFARYTSQSFMLC